MIRVFGHYKIICTECEKVISQCRCPCQNKEIKYSICTECSKKKEA